MSVPAILLAHPPSTHRILQSSQVVAVMLSCVPMHHGLAACPASNDHGTMTVGNRCRIRPIFSQWTLVLSDVVGSHWYVMYVHDRFFYSQTDIVRACCGWSSMVSVWFRLYNQYSWKKKTKNCEHHAGCWFSIDTVFLCMVRFNLYKMWKIDSTCLKGPLILLVFFNPVKAWVI